MNNEISILTPVFGRSKFFPLWVMNLRHQDYPHELLTVIVDECTDKDTPVFCKDIGYLEKLIHPMKLIYHTCGRRRTIGEKRNHLVKMCKTKTFCFMDSDDMYMPTYVSHSYKMLKQNKVGLVGSDKMVFTFPKHDFKLTAIDCKDNISMIHEATMMATKKFFNSTCKFKKNSRGEGVNLFEGLKEHQVFITDIRMLMICLVHDDNTVDKDRFNPETLGNLDFELDDDMKNFIKSILN